MNDSLLRMCLALFHFTLLFANGLDERTPNGVNELRPVSRSERQIRYLGEILVRITVYYDNALLAKHNNDEPSMHEFIYRTVASVNATYRHSNMRSVASFKFLLMKIARYNRSIESHFNDGGTYKQKFCQDIIEDFDGYLSSAVLLTGHNFKYRESKSTSTQGLAILDSICRRGSGCVIVEGRYFKAAIVVAHELGHLFSLEHDSKYNCPEQFIMASHTSEQRHTWSDCSIRELGNNLTAKLTRDEYKKCFDPKPDLDNKAMSVPDEFRSTTADHQCREALGNTFHTYVTNSSQSSICDSIYCTDGDYKIRIEPALENTPCADLTNFACFEGQCRARN